MRNGWTTETALQYLLDLRTSDLKFNDQRFISQQRAVEAALDSARMATEKADAANEKRFESVNEFRGVLSSQQSTYITRSEVKSLFDNQSSKIDNLGGSQNSFVTRVEMFSWVGVAAIVGGVIGHFLK